MSLHRRPSAGARNAALTFTANTDAGDVTRVALSGRGLGPRRTRRRRRRSTPPTAAPRCADRPPAQAAPPACSPTRRSPTSAPARHPRHRLLRQGHHGRARRPSSAPRAASGPSPRAGRPPRPHHAPRPASAWPTAPRSPSPSRCPAASPPPSPTASPAAAASRAARAARPSAAERLALIALVVALRRSPHPPQAAVTARLGAHERPAVERAGCHGAVLLDDGRVLVAGGTTTGDANGARAPPRSTTRRPARWSPAASMGRRAVGRRDGQARRRPRARRGRQRRPGRRAQQRRGLRPRRRTAGPPVRPMPTGRYVASAVLLPDGTVLVAGGVATGSGTDRNRRAFLPGSDEWTGHRRSPATATTRASRVLLPAGGRCRPAAYAGRAARSRRVDVRRGLARSARTMTIGALRTRPEPAAERPGAGHRRRVAANGHAASTAEVDPTPAAGPRARRWPRRAVSTRRRRWPTATCSSPAGEGTGGAIGISAPSSTSPARDRVDAGRAA